MPCDQATQVVEVGGFLHAFRHAKVTGFGQQRRAARGDADYGDILRDAAIAPCGEKGQPVHYWHHQVEQDDARAGIRYESM